MAPEGVVGLCPDSQEEGNNNNNNKICVGDGAAGKGGLDLGLEDYMERLGEEEKSSAEKLQGKLLVSDEVENFYLQSGEVAVSIMELPMWLEDEVVSAGAGLEEVYLVGRSLSESREIRVLAEKWMLELRPKSPPTFLVKTACGWIRAQKPKIHYRKIMSDGLTVTHFLHYVKTHPSASALATREHLASEFRRFAEKPSLEKLSVFFPVLQRYIEVDKDIADSNILKEFFPARFSDVVASCTAKDIKGRSSLQDPQQLPTSTTGRTSLDLDQQSGKEVKDEGALQQGERKSTSSLKKAQRAQVQADLRNLHSQWCNLLGSQPPVKREKKPSIKKAKKQKAAAKKSKPKPKKSENQTSFSKKGESECESESDHDHDHDTVAKTARQQQSDDCKRPQPKRRRTLEHSEAPPERSRRTFEQREAPPESHRAVKHREAPPERRRTFEEGSESPPERRRTFKHHHEAPLERRRTLEEDSESPRERRRTFEHFQSPPERRRTFENAQTQTPLSSTRKARFAHTPSFESESSILDSQPTKLKPLSKLLNARKSQEKPMNLKRNKDPMRPSASSAAGAVNWTSAAAAAPSKVQGGPIRVHSPSEIFDRLEDPPICIICDDGGDLICCEGPCQRHFHATSATDTNCETLGMTSEQVKKIEKYYCKNCMLDQHQCFICQKLGHSSTSLHKTQEVYICDAPGCRKFYHASCVAKFMNPAAEWTEMAERIERGLHGFLCPRHSCAACESTEIQPGVFVQCRRCPKAWHRECLTNFPFSGELPSTSVWKHYDREFVYCKKHKILPDILTPAQDHIRFPRS